METNTQMSLGATESRDSGNRVYLNLRTGKISEVSKNEDESRPGFKPFTTENKSGTKYHFFARTFDDLKGYVKEIKWHEHTLADGTRLAGWNISIDTGGEIEYVLQIQTNDRPYQVLMNLLPSVDFNNPVRIVAFMGKDKNGKTQKVLLMTQNPDQTAKDWVKPAFEQKWLTKDIYNRVKNGLDGIKKDKIKMTEDEEQSIARNVVFKPDGSFDATYPYIKEKSEGGWSFEAWTEFLFDKMESEVLPRVEEAQTSREASRPQYSGKSQFVEPDDFYPPQSETQFESAKVDDNIPW